MIGLFRHKTPGNVPVLLIFGLLLKLPYLLRGQILTAKGDGPLYQSLIDFLGREAPAAFAGTLAFVLLYVQALIINYIVNEYRMMSRQTYLPALAYLLITSLLPEWTYLSAPLVAGVFILWAFVKVYELYHVESVFARVFNIGLFVGIAGFIFFPSLFFSIPILIGIVILRPFRLNEALLFILGALTPSYFYAAYLFLNDRLTQDALLPDLYFHLPQNNPTLAVVIATVLAGFLFLIGGYYIQYNLRKMLIQARRNWSVALLYIAAALVIPMVNNTEQYTNWVLAAAPFAAFHACAYHYPVRRWIAYTLFFMMLAFILVQEYMPHLLDIRTYS